MSQFIPLYFTAVRCSNVIVPENGGIKELNGDAGDFASVVQFTCNEGYELIGNLTIYCKTGSIWSHETPVCESKYEMLIFYCSKRYL